MLINICYLIVLPFELSIVLPIELPIVLPIELPIEFPMAYWLPIVWCCV